MTETEGRSTITVLHVDDDRSVRELVSTKLERTAERIDVVSADSASAGLDRFDEGGIDCIVSDYRMPRTDGLEFLDAIRRLDRDFPFIMFTGRGSEEIASEAVSAGATDYVLKAHDADTYDLLANRVENAVGGYRARTALEESERRFRQVSENIEEVVWMTDADTRTTLYVNPAYEDVWGRSVERLYDEPASFLDAVHPEDVERVRSALDGLAGGEYEEVYRVVQPDGTVRWVHDRGVAVRENGDEGTRIVGIAKDITEYKEAIRERELLLNRITDGFVSLDEEWRFTYVNDRAAAMYDAPADELLGREIWEVVPEAKETPFYEAFTDAFAEQEPAVIEDYFEPWDRWYRGHVYPSEEGISVFFRDVTEQREREQRFEAIFNNTYQFTGLMDLDGTVVEINESALELCGLDRSDVVGKPLFEALDIEPGTLTRETLQRAVDRARNGEFFRGELPFELDGEERVLDFSVRPVEDDYGNVVELVPEGRDITARKRRERTLEALTDVSRDVIRAPSASEIHEVAVAAATDVFDLSAAASYALRTERNALEAVAWRTAGDAEADPPRVEAGDDVVWNAFAEQEPAYDPRREGVTAVPGTGQPRSEVVVPLGDHGVLVAGNTGTDAFDESEIDFLQLLGTMVEAALDRDSGQSALRERERTLERFADDLSRLQLHSRIAREAHRTIVAAESRRELERGLCENLGGLDGFAGAWIGAHDPVTDDVEPSVWRGVPDRFFERGADSLYARHRELVRRAIETGEVQVSQNVLGSTDRAAERKEALEHRFHAVACVPLSTSATPVGVLVVYASESGAFSDEAVTVLEESGAVVGRAIQSQDRSRAVLTNTALALELELFDPDCPYVGLAAEAGGKVSIEGTVPGADQITQFVTVATDSPERVRSFVDSIGTTENVELLNETDDTALFRIETADETVLEPLRERGGTLQSLTATDSGVELRVHLPHGTDVRALVESYRRAYETVELTARCETAPDELDSSVSGRVGVDRLTDRQREALLLAYHSGYFESPRRVTGTELAETMGVSAPTFHGHLRAAEAQLFDSILE